ncbi:hypothetical protein RAB80_017343 [Fusarium oxysporum f. sp. vasinfectum]|nr:hypothetical protein RAB80_017343 [Fusarium oxysporum f. sp. vasinfectum]KAK2931882.1 hypothetical protein FoTM2_009400 [Fusarium oxysporum f. sp. vasinfectum]
MPQEKPTIACFGATGGCVAAALTSALKDGFYCTALARTPEKLRSILIDEHKIPLDTINQYLTIYEGDIKDPAIVQKALISPTHTASVVDFILSGVGAYPTFQWSLIRPFPLTDPTITEDAMNTIYAALSSLSASSITNTSAGQKPLLVAISTAGCGRNRGIPLPIYLPYHYLLGGPLADKKRMEKVIMAGKSDYIRDFVIMRPLILTDGEAKGENQLRVGWEWGTDDGMGECEEPGPEIGYLVSRKDVGKWMFDNVVVQGGWEGKCVYLTY